MYIRQTLIHRWWESWYDWCDGSMRHRVSSYHR